MAFMIELQLKKPNRKYIKALVSGNIVYVRALTPRESLAVAKASHQISKIEKRAKHGKPNHSDEAKMFELLETIDSTMRGMFGRKSHQPTVEAIMDAGAEGNEIIRAILDSDKKDD